jgi:hypothetical protein
MFRMVRNFTKIYRKYHVGSDNIIYLKKLKIIKKQNEIDKLNLIIMDKTYTNWKT